MSTRAIAPIVGTTHKTIVKDLQVVPPVPPEPKTMMLVNPDTGEVEDVPARHITGIDGKEYAVPLQKKPGCAGRDPGAPPLSCVRIRNSGLGPDSPLETFEGELPEQGPSADVGSRGCAWRPRGAHPRPASGSTCGIFHT